MMKRKILIGASFILLAWAATSCDKTNCQQCKIVTRKISDNSIVSSNGGSEYCGVEVAAYKAANPKITNTVLGTVTQVECN
jgi:hypothetical protein